MKMLIFTMNIEEKKESEYFIKITYKDEKTRIRFNPNTKELEFLQFNNVTNILKQNEYQLRKILHNKRKNTFYEGFNLKFSLRYQKDVEAFNDRSKIVVLDKRCGVEKSYVVDKGEEKIFKLYTDGSFSERYNRGGYAVLIKDFDNEYTFYTFKTKKKNSSLIELLAAIKGLEILEDKEKVRIITDSQYVRKGLTEWIQNWKLNNWHTVNGHKVKHIEYWKQFDKLTANKYIEFEWVKGHSNHFENTICDLYAKDVAEKI